MKFTVDASIVVKWYIAETHSEDARRLLAHRLERYAPDFLLIEFANTVWKKARRGEIADPKLYLDEMARIGEAVTLLPTADLARRAARLASELDHPVYDCLYLACAEATGSTLITADRRFAAKVADGLPGTEVRHIGTPGVADEIDAAATALVIPRRKIEELVAAHDLLLETDGNVRSSLRQEPTGRGNIDPEDLDRILFSPASRRLQELFDGFTEEERIDLLALGWLGEGGSGSEWRPIFEQACKTIDLYAEDNWGDVLALQAYWREGYRRLTGNSV